MNSILPKTTTAAPTANYTEGHHRRGKGEMKKNSQGKKRKGSEGVKTKRENTTTDTGKNAIIPSR